MVDEFNADLRGETLFPEADFRSFARRRKIESAILFGNSRAVIGHSWRLVSNGWLIETVSYGIDDPLAIRVRAEGVAADRRLRSDRAIAIHVSGCD